MHYNILTIYVDKPDEGNKVTNGGHREVLLVFWTWARAQNHLEFGCRVLFDHYHPINPIKVIPEHLCPLSISSCGGVYHRICPRAPDICLVIKKRRKKESNLVHFKELNPDMRDLVLREYMENSSEKVVGSIMHLQFSLLFWRLCL